MTNSKYKNHTYHASPKLRNFKRKKEHKIYSIIMK